jgi:hypothetical protein
MVMLSVTETFNLTAGVPVNMDTHARTTEPRTGRTEVTAAHP